MKKKGSTIHEQVLQIGDAVRKRGDKALIDFTLRFDGVALSSFVVNATERSTADRETPALLKKAIQSAKKNIYRYHQHQLRYLQQSAIETMSGIKCYRKFSAIDTVGIYIPGGSAPLFSSVLMTVIPAKLAGCKRIVLCTPPNKEGTIAPAILYAAALCGCHEVYKVGGAQAIFAMAYGTKSIPQVQKMVGPGNAYVNEAKKIVSTFLPIDMPAGPSEVMVIADAEQPPQIVASDILSQLEHDPHAKACLIAYDRETIEKTKRCIEQRIAISTRKEILKKSIRNYTTHLVKTDEEALRIANQYAPEHLILSTSNAKALAKQVVHAGSVFIGRFAAESIGDYASGTNHTLPTNGYAKNYSGLSVESFGKWTSFQEISSKGFQRIAPIVKTMSQYEALEEHRNAIIEREILLTKK